MDFGEKTSRLLLLAQSLAEKTQGFFEVKGPGPGDLAANEFVANLRSAAKQIFGGDFSEAKICGENKFSIDFYFEDEETAVELSFGLDKPLSEYERDIFKCLLAQDAGHPVRKLLLVSKPGGQKRLDAPGPRAIKDWVERKHNLEIEVWDLVTGESPET
jgi:hypothetical protein